MLFEEINNVISHRTGLTDTQNRGITVSKVWSYMISKMWKYHITLSVVICVTSSASIGSRSTKCGPGWYFDSVIGHCDTCDSICDYAELQGTVHDCLTNCPGFISGVLKHTTTSTTTTESSYRCESERRTITFLLIALSGVSILLVAVICAVMFMIIRGHVTIKQRSTNSYSTVTERLVSTQDQSLSNTRTELSENYFPERGETNNPSEDNPSALTELVNVQL